MARAVLTISDRQHQRSCSAQGLLVFPRHGAASCFCYICFQTMFGISKRTSKALWGRATLALDSRSENMRQLVQWKHFISNAAAVTIWQGPKAGWLGSWSCITAECNCQGGVCSPLDLLKFSMSHVTQTLTSIYVRTGVRNTIFKIRRCPQCLDSRL